MCSCLPSTDQAPRSMPKEVGATHHSCGSLDRPGGSHLIVVCDGLAGTAKVVVCDVEHLTAPTIVVVVCIIQQQIRSCIKCQELQPTHTRHGQTSHHARQRYCVQTLTSAIL